MKKSTITSRIKQTMEKGGGTVRDVHKRLNADPKVKKQLDGKTVPIQTVATALHKGDVKRNPRGWVASTAERPLCYTLTRNAGEAIPDAPAQEPLMESLLPIFATAMQIGLQVLAARPKPGAVTNNLAEVLAAAVKNFTYPHDSARLIGRQKRA